MPTRIDPTIHVLTGPLTEAAAKKGVEMIGKWEADIEAAEFTGAKTIHGDLVKLRHHLETGKFDGIGELLVKLGGSTSRAAAHAEGTTGTKLETLGQALAKAGEGLGGKQSE